MCMNSIQMIAYRIIIRFTRLGHNITYKQLYRFGCHNRISESWHEQIRNNAGIQAARSDQNSICLF
ncbi:hypothetical protein D3C78_1542220 [compost metagenome]